MRHPRRVPVALRPSPVDLRRNLDVFGMLPSSGSAGRRLASLHGVLRGEVPRFDGTITALRLPAARPAAPRCLRWAVPPRPLVLFAPRRTSAPPGPGVVDPVSRPGPRGGDDRISQVPGEPRLPVCPVQSTPAGPRAPDHYGAAARPPVSEQQGLPRTVFRRSIAWLSDSLSPLRRAGYPAATPDSLPAAGPALLDGLFTRRVPTKGFRVLATSHPPFPSLLGAIGSTDASANLPARVGVVGPKRASLDSAAHNPDVGASDPGDRLSRVPSRSRESEDEDRRSTRSGGSGLRLPPPMMHPAPRRS